MYICVSVVVASEDHNEPRYVNNISTFLEGGIHESDELNYLAVGQISFYPDKVGVN